MDRKNLCKVNTKNNKHLQFEDDKEKKWNGPFYFIQGADSQLGFINNGLKKIPNAGWEEDKQLSSICVEKINALRPKPKFFVICGDLCDAFPSEATTRKLQEEDFKEIFSKVDPEIPIVLVCGNHDLGNKPTTDSVQKYKESFGDDYFSFWAGGVHFLIINSQFYFDSSEVKDMYNDQCVWLDEKLNESKSSRHGPVIFQHIPWFIEDPEADDGGYFCMKLDVRKPMLEKLYNAGVRYTFCGHLHRNAGGFYKKMENIITSAIGGQLGNNQPGFRIVKVHSDKISHQYYAYENVPSVIEL